MEKDNLIDKINTTLLRYSLKSLHQLEGYLSRPNKYQPKTRVDADISSHTFEEVDFNTYRCVKCGMEGKLEFLFPLVLSVDRYVECSTSLVNILLQPQGEVRMMRDLPDFGLYKGEVHKIVSCPVAYQDRYADKVWVFSELRNEPVRLLNREYDLI